MLSDERGSGGDCMYSRRQKSCRLACFTEARDVHRLEFLRCRKRALVLESMNTACLGEAAGCSTPLDALGHVTALHLGLIDT
ncbi:hypothetical protein Pcinc_017778 [Petrolisthes cinctipes]|uniref:Uncharacterized protein n=1 Tax=Petrolisthes cinctipes TaxID=88211 RepID=A0AAE1FNM7_PETCI|nr:hypothetical protein Pcinc_017778 [Petrolisthes cinctipes]